MRRTYKRLSIIYLTIGRGTLEDTLTFNFSTKSQKQAQNICIYDPVGNYLTSLLGLEDLIECAQCVELHSLKTQINKRAVKIVRTVPPYKQKFGIQYFIIAVLYFTALNFRMYALLLVSGVSNTISQGYGNYMQYKFSYSLQLARRTASILNIKPVPLLLTASVSYAFI